MEKSVDNWENKPYPKSRRPHYYSPEAVDRPLPDGEFTCHRSVIGGDYEVLGLQVASADFLTIFFT